MPGTKMTTLALTAAIASGVQITYGDQIRLEPCKYEAARSDGNNYYFTVKGVPMAYFSSYWACNMHRNHDCGHNLGYNSKYYCE